MEAKQAEIIGDSANKPKPAITFIDNSKKEEKKSVSILGRIKKIRHIELILAGLAILVMLVIYFSSNVSFGGGTRGTNAQPNNSQENHLQRIERQLSEAFSLLEGAGETRVIINWESSIEQVIAYIVSENQSGSSSAPQIITGGGVQGPIVLKEIYPRPIGALIVTQGGASARLQIEMINAVSILLDLAPAHIQVLTMRS